MNPFREGFLNLLLKPKLSVVTYTFAYVRQATEAVVHPDKASVGLAPVQ